MKMVTSYFVKKWLGIANSNLVNLACNQDISHIALFPRDTVLC